jgi:[ribosomal protein S5]-alanine N-acetyltransferase
MRYMGGVRTEEQSRCWLRENLRHWHLHEFGLWIFRDIIDGTFVGRCGLRRVEVGGDNEVELGYVMMRPYWHKGLGIEMTRAILRISFASDAGSIIALIQPQNLPSRRLAQRVGFNFERNVTWKSTPAMLFRKVR